MFVDFVLNGQGHGPVGEALGEVRFDPGILRPFLNSKGIPCVTINTGRMKYNDKLKRHAPIIETVPVSMLVQRGVNTQVFNAISMRRESWIEMDRAVIRAARQRLSAWRDLEGANSFGGFDGMARMTLEYDAMSDPGEAVVDMDGIVDARTDSPLFKTRSIPLPITHSDFWFSARRLAVARNGGTALDTTMAEAAGRRVAEMIEKTVIGVETGPTYGTQTVGYGAHDGTSTVYGYTNFPNRITKTNLTIPLGTNPDATVGDVISMREAAYAAGYFGPFMLYHSTGYDRWLDDDYFRAGSTAQVRTLRERIAAISGINGIRRLDYLTSGYQLILVQMTSNVARAINGMGITTVQWESQGGLRVNFKVMAIQVPQLRSDFNGNTGIVHGTTA
jgi:hypothetical protein